MKNLGVVALGLMISVLVSLPTFAADITVNDNCSLPDAIKAANVDEQAGGCPAGDGVDVIALTADVRLQSALPLINSDLTIEGNGHSIVGSGRTHIFGIGKRGNLTIDAARIYNGTSAWGGAFGNFGDLVITNSIVANNSASEGGAIGNEGILSIRNSVFSGNTADTTAGAIHSVDGTVTVTRSAFIDNSTLDGGGAIHVLWGTLNVSASTFIRNTASSNWERGGGAIFLDDGAMEITSSVFYNNVVAHEGGAVYINDGSATIASSTFSSNRSRNNGGAIYDDEGPLLVASSTFIDNQSDASGGAIYDYYGNETFIRNSTFVNNRAKKSGGAIAKARRSGSIANVTMVDNSASQGGGLYKSSEYSNNLPVFNSIIAGSERGGDCFGRLDQNVANLIEDGSCFADFSGDPMLSELIEPEKGAPAYFVPLDGSPVIDAGDRSSCLKIDQLGTQRIQGDGCDIGAIEIPKKGTELTSTASEIISAINEGIDVSLSIEFDILPPPIAQEILTIIEGMLGG